MLMDRKFVLSMKMVSKLFGIDASRASQYHDVLIVGQSWLWANLGLPTLRVCCVSVLTGIELGN